MKNRQISENKEAEILEKIRNGTGSTLKRAGAYLLDIIVISILFIFTLAFLQYLGIDLIGLPSELTLTVGGFIPVTYSYLLTLFLFSLIHLVYFVLLESDKILGSSLGKIALSMRVVNTHGQGIGLDSSLIRNVFRLLWPIPFIDFEILLFTESLTFPNIAYVALVIMLLDLLLIIRDDQRIGDRLARTYVVYDETYESIFNDYWKDKGTQDTIEPTPKG